MSSFLFFARVCALYRYRLQNMAEFQAKPWFPAYLACLLDPLWPIPGLSVWWSERIKIFLREIQADCYLTFHLPVAATARRQDGIADANCVESTICEGRVLLLTTEAMDYWLRVDRASSCTRMLSTGLLRCGPLSSGLTYTTLCSVSGSHTARTWL